jgi:hypothetical protein
MRFSLSARPQESKRVLVFARRIVNARWRRSFSTASCEVSLVSPLSAKDTAKLERLLREDEKLRLAFEAYAPEPVDLVVNLSMGVPDRSVLEDFCRKTLAPAMASGVQMDEVLRLLDEANLSQFLQKYPIRATLQLVCPDHEVRDGEFVLRACRVLPF